MRFMARWACVALVTIAAGCGAHSAEHTLSSGDLRRIVTVGPMTAGWAWPPEPIPTGTPPPSESPIADETPSPISADPLTSAFDGQIAAAGGLVAADGSRWQDDQKLGVTVAWLLKSPTAARTVLVAARAFQRGWAERTVAGGHFTDLPIEGLGDEAWRVQSDFPGGQEVTYGWRRASLVMQVHVQCIFATCPSDIVRAARAWVDDIDTEAVTTIGSEP
jgi:hypothetical protein